MKSTRDVLTEDEFRRYGRGWESFREKYKLNSRRNTHSGKSIKKGDIP